MRTKKICFNCSHLIEQLSVLNKKQILFYCELTSEINKTVKQLEASSLPDECIYKFEQEIIKSG